MEVRTPDAPEAVASAKRLVHIFDSCGYRASLCVDDRAGREGLFIESPHATAGCALALQSAFHSAGVDATVAIRDVGLHDTIVIHIGPRGLP